MNFRLHTKDTDDAVKAYEMLFRAILLHTDG